MSQEGKRDGNLFGAVRDLKRSEKELTPEEQEAIEAAKFDQTKLCGRIAVTKTFEWSTLGVIVFNALYLGYDCDYGARWGKPEDLYSSTLYGFMFFDNAFCLFFSGELLIRFFGYKTKMTGMKDKPFLFDLALVVMMVVETWILGFLGPIAAMKQVSILRLLRLTRLFRMAKLMRYFPELQLIVKGMLAAVRSVGCASILLVLALYVFAIIFTNEYHQGDKADDDPDIPDIEVLFGSLGKSMRHLLIMATILDDITACTNAIRATGKIQMLLMFIVCVLVSSFTLFNMLLGILCEVVEATEAGEKEKEEQLQLSSTILTFFKKMDVDQNGTISRSEFLKMYNDSSVMDTLAKLHVRQQEFEKYAELLFKPKEEGGPVPNLVYEDAVSMIMRLRPGQCVNACDFEIFKQTIMKGNRDIDRYLSGLEMLLEEAAGAAHGDHVSEADDEDDTTEIFPYSPFSEDPCASGETSASLADLRSTAKVNNRPNRPAQTIKSLASSMTADVAATPPLASRWNMSPPRSPAGIDKSALSPRNFSHQDMVTERLNTLAEKRRALSSNLRSQMPAGAMNPKANYVMPSYANYQPFPYQNSPPNEDDYLDEDIPWSPQQMTSCYS